MKTPTYLIYSAAAVIGLGLASTQFMVQGGHKVRDHVWVHLYHSLSAEAQGSPLIVEGRVLSITKTWTTNQVGFTQYAVIPRTVLKGTVPPSGLLVDQTGIAQSLSKNQQQVTDDPLIQTGTTYIFFLIPSGLNDGAYFPINGPQGRYVVKNQHIYSLDQQFPATQGETIPVNGWLFSQFRKSVGHIP